MTKYFIIVRRGREAPYALGDPETGAYLYGDPVVAKFIARGMSLLHDIEAEVGEIDDRWEELSLPVYNSGLSNRPADPAPVGRGRSGGPSDPGKVGGREAAT